MPRNHKQDENLKRGKDTQFKSGENAAKNGRKGGIISVCNCRVVNTTATHVPVLV